MGEWEKHTLGELVIITNGFAFKSEDFLLEKLENSLPVIKIKNVANGDVHLNDCLFHKYDESLKKYLIRKNDILIALTGNHPEVMTQVVGEASRYKLEDEAIINQRVAKIEAKTNLDNNFLYYFLKDDITHDYLASQSTGSANQANISKANIEELIINCPPLSEQLAIASILSSLDNKIDLLHRQNKTLEALAETLFRQWFIEERPQPSHNPSQREGNMKADESWEEKSLDEIIYFNPPEKMDRDNEYNFFEMKCLSNNSMMIADGIKRRVSSASSFRNSDTLLAKITPCLENGKTGYVMNLEENEIGRGSTEFIVMRTKGKVSPYYIYCLTRSDDFRETAILSMTGTSGRQRVQVDVLKKYTITFNQETVNRFDNAVKSSFEKIKTNQIQIRTLTQLRDTLLPKLMSGEVRVKNV